MIDVRSPAKKLLAFDAVSAALWQLPERSRDRATREMAIAHGVDIPAMLAREMMSWEEARLLASDPLCDLGGHTIDHVALSSLDGEEARAEIVGGIDRLQAMTGRRARTFAYPYGDATAVSSRDCALVEDLGLSVAVTTAPGLVGAGIANRTAWPRVSLNGFLQTRREFDVLMSGVPFLIDGSRLPAWVRTGAAMPRG
jgi:peptidoglycan/xylan/chitin deacetylase (PgdA/CDA1 family)